MKKKLEHTEILFRYVCLYILYMYCVYSLFVINIQSGDAMDLPPEIDVHCSLAFFGFSK